MVGRLDNMVAYFIIFFIVNEPGGVKSSRSRVLSAALVFASRRVVTVNVGCISPAFETNELQQSAFVPALRRHGSLKLGTSSKDLRVPGSG